MANCSKLGHRCRPIDGRQVHGEEWARGGEQTWKTFLHDHVFRHRRDGLPGRADYQFFGCCLSWSILRHEAATALISLSVTDHPTAEWIRPPRSQMPFPWDEAPDYMVRDRDKCYGHAVTKRLAAMGIRDHPIAPRSPWQKRACGETDRLDPQRMPRSHRRLRAGPTCGESLPPTPCITTNCETHLSLGKDSPRHRSVRRLGQLAAQPILGRTAPRILFGRSIQQGHLTRRHPNLDLSSRIACIFENFFSTVIVHLHMVVLFS